LRVDAIEDGMNAFGISDDQIAGSGYVAMANLAAENLALGFSSVVDCVNPLPLTRQMFLDVSSAAGCELMTVEVICSDLALHRARLEARGQQPTWKQVLDREYQPWHAAQFRIDTAEGNPADWIEQLNHCLTPDVAGT
jgi:predicted kinase